MVQVTECAKVICCGSGHSLKQIHEWDTNGITIVGVNNVWRVTDKWDHMLYPADYKMPIPTKEQQQTHSSRGQGLCIRKPFMHYSGEGNSTCTKALGPTMYFHAAYWSLYWLKPKYLGFIGFDMNYKPDENGHTASYGVGEDIKKRGKPDPFYQMRFYKGTAKENLNRFFELLRRNAGDTRLFNLSNDVNTILPWDRITFDKFKELAQPSRTESN